MSKNPDKKKDEAQQEASEVKLVQIAETEYQNLQDQLKESREKYVRLLAECDNMRKRQERERVEFIRYANEALMIDFLNVVDDLERTVTVAKEKHQDYDAFLKGVEMVMGRVQSLLKKQGVEFIDPVGKPFDPYAHEILAQEPTKDFPDGVVMESFQKGYRIGDKVIRTAKVKVAMQAAEAQSPAAAKEDGQPPDASSES